MADDTIFGIYVNDKMKLVNHRARRVGGQHSHRISPVDSGPGDSVTVYVTTPGKEAYEKEAYEKEAYEQAVLYYTIDGHKPAGRRGVAETGTAISLCKIKIEWDYESIFDRYWGKHRKLKRATAFQMQLPQATVIYYGTEVRMRQEKNMHEKGSGGYAEARHLMLWGEVQDQEILTFYKQVIAKKKDNA